jgi:hypothetical protein
LKVYTVFKIDHIRRVKKPVGLVVERRNRDRGNNFEGLLKLAKKKYPPPRDSHIVLELIE